LTRGIQLNLAGFAVALILYVPPCSAQAKSATAKSTNTADDQSQENVYKNPLLGFRYPIPFGWVDRTRELQGDESEGTPETGQSANGHASRSGSAQNNPTGSGKSHSQVLLGVFEHPPEATTANINSAVVIASESLASYPGLKTAEDYARQMSEIVTAKGFKPDGEAYGVDEDGRHLLRADFTRTLGFENAGEELIMHQSTLILLTKTQIVSFTFLAAGEEELDELMDGLHFTSAGASSAKNRPH
jgi:hypothetical protein